ncbi:MAG: LUD domain-containing protein [Prevotella sp.]|nr:LUD domain-containing protein [Prevotella sp.]
MSNTRENILSALRKNVRETYDMPNLGQLKPITYGDPVAEFKTKTTTTAGARLIEARVGDDLNALVRQAYPDAQLIASNLQGVNAQLNPDNCSVEELERVDVGVIEGKIGVAENACIWVPQQMKEKTVCFASQQLVIVLRQRDVVNNMHEAYDRIAASSEYFQQYKFGTFISGPSKTADIESALVYGAQAARGVTVVLLSD